MARQLRVRVTDQQRQLLEELGKSRGRGENLSDIVRLIITEANASSLARSSDAITISPEIGGILAGLAEELGRKPQSVLEDCIRGIQSIIEGDERPPLIAEEIRLRRRYRSAVSKVKAEGPGSQPKK